MTREARWFWLVVLYVALGAMAVHWNGLRAPSLEGACAPTPRLSRWLDREPSSATALSRRGDLWLEKRDYQRACREYRAALNRGCRHPALLNNLAWSLALLGRFEEALPYAEESVRAQRAPYALDTLGYIQAGLGNDDEARRLYAEALRLEPDNPEIREHFEALESKNPGPSSSAER